MVKPTPAATINMLDYDIKTQIAQFKIIEQQNNMIGGYIDGLVLD